jgi:hypothetical protein
MKRQHLVAALLVLAHLALATAFSLMTPLGEAPDEADHWAYIVYLAEERSLPVGPRVTQSKHPPLYHVSAAAVASLATPDHRFLRANPDVELTPRPGWSPNFFIHTAQETWPWADSGPRAFHLARFWSVLLSALTVAATYGLTLTAFPARSLLALAATGVLAFVPEFAFIGGSANNDNAAALFGTLSVWAGLLLWRRGGQLRSVWWAPLALGAGLLSKTSTVGVWPPVGLAILLGAAAVNGQPASLGAWWRAGVSSWRRWLPTGLYVFGGALALASPWWLRNWRLYGDPLGMALAIQTVDVRSEPWTWADTTWLLSGWFRSFWGKFGGAGHIPLPEPVYGLLLGVTLVSAMGLVGNLWSGRRRYALLPLLLLALAAGGVALVMARYSLIALGTDQGRLLYPAVAPLVILWTGGLLWWAPPRFERSAALLLVGAMAALGIYGLLGVVRPAFAPPEAPSPAAVESARAAEPIRIGDLILMGWELDETPTLYWQAGAAPTEDYRVTLRVVAEDGALVWEWSRSPGAGRWSTDRWPAGAVVADVYAIGWPDWAGSGRYRVEVGVRPFGGDLIAPAGQSGSYTMLGAVDRQGN